MLNLQAYTSKAASNHTDVKRELVDLSIEEANESFRQAASAKCGSDSCYRTDYVEEGSHFDHVWRLAASPTFSRYVASMSVVGVSVSEIGHRT